MAYPDQTLPRPAPLSLSLDATWVVTVIIIRRDTRSSPFVCAHRLQARDGRVHTSAHRPPECQVEPGFRD